jgi:hypothetical protein
MLPYIRDEEILDSIKTPFRALARALVPFYVDGEDDNCFPAHAAFPKWPEGQHPHCLRPSQASLTLRLGLLSRPRRPLSRGSSPSGCPAGLLVSFQFNRQLPGWTLPPAVIRAFGAHAH